jgi:hypothetical protein
MANRCRVCSRYSARDAPLAAPRVRGMEPQPLRQDWIRHSEKLTSTRGTVTVTPDQVSSRQWLVADQAGRPSNTRPFFKYHPCNDTMRTPRTCRYPRESLASGWQIGGDR